MPELVVAGTVHPSTRRHGDWRNAVKHINDSLRMRLAFLAQAVLHSATSSDSSSRRLGTCSRTHRRLAQDAAGDVRSGK